MAMTQKERDSKQELKRLAAGEEELRMRTQAGTRQALSELMQWHGIVVQGEAMTLMIHHLHAMGPEGSARFLAPPKHHITPTPKQIAAIYQAPWPPPRTCQQEIAYAWVMKPAIRAKRHPTAASTRPR